VNRAALAGAAGPPAGAGRQADPSGPLTFARFAYPPNALGYCGPGDPASLLHQAASGAEGRAVGAAARRFEGAWPYLQLIASCNGIDDPLDRRVVEAYWIGNSLLGKVRPPALVASLEDRFERRVRRDFGEIAGAAFAGATPHHSFHVFAVYPWLGLLRGGMEGAPLVVLDRCRIRWAEVLATEGDFVVCRGRRLSLRGASLVPGEVTEEVVRRSEGGVGTLQDVRAGDMVALHWDWVCQVLTPGALRRLRHATVCNLRAVNAAAAPGPAVACDRDGGPSG
jgi:hypothetical protein